MELFVSDGGGWAVAREDAGGGGEGEEVLSYGLEEGGGVAGGEVGSADGLGEEGVTGEDGF